MNLETPLALVSPVPQLDISHHASDELGPTSVDNAPPALDTATPTRPGIIASFFGSSGTRHQEEGHITERLRRTSPDALPSSTSEEQRLLQFRIDTEAAEQRMANCRMETEMTELDAKKAAAEAALEQSRQWTRALEQESSGNLGTSPCPSPPRERRSPRRSPSPPTEVAALLKLFQMQQQQAADQRREDDRRREDQEQRREDR